ncbi:hypothetical protein ARMGADRAFT_1140550 [Armillaria gallica]|uniref:Uncharacterized protein n=1 Tax=Armillaria gallica TaxID=47427 RepID=A0A2H3CI42_ARMGA|nr:hypothetical protein ARMGADRAFT_1140550 [Armillaria gallica]
MQTGTPVQAEWVLDSIQNPVCIDIRIVEVMHASIMSNSSMIPTSTRSAAPSIEMLHGETSSAIPGHSPTLQPLVLLKALCSTLKDALSGILYPLASPEEIEELLRKILLLEGLEAQLADEYGMTRDIDSVEVFDETKARAFSENDANTISVLKDLYMLYQLALHTHTMLTPPDSGLFSLGLMHMNASLYMHLFGSKEHTSSDNYHIPTLVNIIQALVGLMNNAEIQNGDNIIIYFSGHRLGYSTTGYCSNTNDSIEALCPIDCMEGNGLHILIKKSTQFSKTSPMFDITDENSRQFPGYQSVCSEKWYPDMSSHVVLAACQENQVIMEMRKEDRVQNASGCWETQECTDLVSGPVIILLSGDARRRPEDTTGLGTNIEDFVVKGTESKHYTYNYDWNVVGEVLPACCLVHQDDQGLLESIIFYKDDMIQNCSIVKGGKSLPTAVLENGKVVPANCHPRALSPGLNAWLALCNPTKNKTPTKILQVTTVQ